MQTFPGPTQFALQRRWNDRYGNFAKGTRCLLGKPITVDSLREALKTGYQRPSAAAGTRACDPQTGASPIRSPPAPAWRQKSML